jgi:hypothetical protein
MARPKQQLKLKRIDKLDFNPEPDIIALRDYLSTLATISLCDYACELSRSAGGFAMATAMNLSSPMRQIYYALGLASTTNEPSCPDELDQNRLAHMLNAVEHKYTVKFMTPSPRTTYDAKMTAMDSFIRDFMSGRNVTVAQVRQRIAAYLSPFEDTLESAFGISSQLMVEMADWLIEHIQHHLDSIHRLFDQANSAIFLEAAQMELRVRAQQEFGEWIHDFRQAELEGRFGPVAADRFTSTFALQRVATATGYFWFDDTPNPFARTPILRVGNDRFAIPVANELYNAIWDTCTEAVIASPATATRFFKHRGKQLEKDGAVVLRRLLPEGTSYGLVFEQPGTDEHDLLIIWKDVAVVLEAKAGEPAMPMRNARLAFERLKQQFRSKAGIQHGFRQGQNLANRLLIGESVTLYDDRQRPLITIPPGTIKRAYVIVLTLDDFRSLATDLTTLLDKGDSEPYPWAVNLYDIELFADVLLEVRHWDSERFIQWLNERRSRMGDFSTHDELEIAGIFIEHESLYALPGDAIIAGTSKYANIFEDYAHEKLGDVPAVVGQVSIDDFVPFPEDVKREFGEMFRGLERQVVGRNDLCPCGSGKKYKRCHGAA